MAQPSSKGHFGEYGGAYIPETLHKAVSELEAAFKAIKGDKAFQAELSHYLTDYVGRPTPLYFAERLSKETGLKLYLKREDLNHTGAHKINNAIGQVLLAKRMGKTRIIAETGAGQHGVATATACSLLNIECVVYMGEEDIRRQALNVYRMKLMNAKIEPVTSGSRTLKEAVTEAIRDWMGSSETSHYVIGSALGPHPYPLMVREFQSIIGKEAKKQILKKEGRLPHHILACVGGGSNATGIFAPFYADTDVQLHVAEAAGRGLDSGEHAAALSKGSPGVLHGAKSYLLQSKAGQVSPVHSISAGLDYPGISPEISYYYDKNRIQLHTCTDDAALKACKWISALEGIIPALETSHAFAILQQENPFKAGEIVVLNVSGRGDKDMETIRSYEL